MGPTASSQTCQFLDKSTYTLKQHHYTWEIKDFISLNCDTGKSLEMENLKLYSGVPDAKWTVILYPQGFNERVQNYVSLWFKKLSREEVLLKFTCAVHDSGGMVFYSKSLMRNMCLEAVLGWATFCKRSDIFDKKNKILKNGNLILELTVDVYTPKETFITMVDDDLFLASDLREMSHNFESLLSSKDFSDINIVCEDETFPVHRAILSARSPTFRDYFQSKSCTITSLFAIKHMSKESASEMIKYIYSGQTDIVSFKLAVELFHAAHNFQLLNLKRKCSKLLAGNLKVEEAASVLSLASKLNDNWLKVMVIEFLKKNMSQVSKTESWFNLIKCEPELANSVFCSLAEDTST